jgi:hypothetical protein
MVRRPASRNFGIGNPAPWNSHLRKGEMRLLILAFLCAAWWPKVAQANDRPFLLTTHAVAEEDDDEVWSVETWWQRAGPVQAFTIAPEYAFNPTTSMQFQASRATGRANALEIEFKHLFNHIGRDGWGWGIELSGEVAGTGSDWKHHGVALKLPYTLQLPGGDALLHLNAGLQKQRGERREWVGSAAFEHKLPGATPASSSSAAKIARRSGTRACATGSGATSSRSMSVCSGKAVTMAGTSARWSAWPGTTSDPVPPRSSARRSPGLGPALRQEWPAGSGARRPGPGPFAPG